MGSRVSRSGGAYAYVEEAFGPFVGFIASILFWFGFQALADAAIIVVGAFALSGTFKYLAVVATGSQLLVDLGVVLAVPRLRRRDGLPKEGEFRLPFGPVVPVLSCAVVGWLLLQMPLAEAATVAALVGVCVAFYAIRAVFRGRRKARGDFGV